MKKIKNVVIAIVITVIIISISGCYGSFGLTKQVYKWNGKVGDKYVKEAVFIGLNIIPVYPVCVLLDGVFLNSVEFWTGRHPMALNNGVNKIQYNGRELTIDINDNLAVIYDKDKIEATLKWNDEDQSWYITNNDGTYRLMSVDGNVLTTYSTNGDILFKEVASVD